MTAQIPDTIELDGIAAVLKSTPLDGLAAALDRDPFPFVAPHTGNWRGYRAGWRVVDDRLHLIDVTGHVAGVDGRLVEVQGRDALGGIELPLVAHWVTGSLVAAWGDMVRYVHQSFENRYEHEVVLEVVEGVVIGREKLATPPPMGSAGPYQLHEPLLFDLSGGAFGQVIAATDLEGRPLVAKVARPRASEHGGTQMWIRTPEGRRPLHVPAIGFRRATGGRWSSELLEGEVMAQVLRREAEVLGRDDGVLLPRSLGLWSHDPNGNEVLVMERLEGRRPQNPADVRAVLAALADAVERNVFHAHGDVKVEHVFIADDGRVRLCDPAPRFEDPDRRAYTPLYNPRGWTGPAADVVACATILRYLPGAPTPGWRWASELLDNVETPPSWAGDHRHALARLDAELAHPQPPPPGWVLPPLDERPDTGAPLPPPSPTGTDPGLPVDTVSGERLAETLQRLNDDASTVVAVLRSMARFDGPGAGVEHRAAVQQLADQLAAMTAILDAAGDPVLDSWPGPEPGPIAPRPPQDGIDLIPVGSQTTSAVGGGGGQVTVHATSAPLDRVQAWLQDHLERTLAGRSITVEAEFGDRRSMGWTGWTVRWDQAGWRTVRHVSIIRPDPAGGRWQALCPVSDVPAGTTFLVQESTASVPSAP